MIVLIFLAFALVPVQRQLLQEGEAVVVVILLVLAQMVEVPGRADAHRLPSGSQRLGDVFADGLRRLAGGVGGCPSLYSSVQAPAQSMKGAPLSAGT